MPSSQGQEEAEFLKVLKYNTNGAEKEKVGHQWNLEKLGSWNILTIHPYSSMKSLNISLVLL